MQRYYHRFFTYLICMSMPFKIFAMTGLYDHDVFESIESALETDNVKPVAQFIQRNPRVTSDDHGWTLLHRAASTGATKIIEYLLSLPQIPHNVHENHTQRTPLHIAIGNAHSQVGALTLIADPKTAVNSKDIGQETPLHYAVRLYRPELVKALVRRSDIQINSQDMFGNTSLHKAAHMGFLDLVKLLLQAGADETVQNNKQQTAAQLAHETGHEESAVYITQFSALKQQLFNAIRQNNIPVVKQLLKIISPARITDAQGNTPLHIAADQASAELVALLLDVAPHTAARTNNAGETPIHKASNYPAKLAVFFHYNKQ